MQRHRLGYVSTASRMTGAIGSPGGNKRICQICREPVLWDKPHLKCEEKALANLPSQRHPK